jgi:hypothetical protein
LWQSQVYKKYSLEEIPWHSDDPDPALVSLLKKKKGKNLNRS